MDKIPKTRASLILRLPSTNDVSAWQEFTEIYEPFVYRYARRQGLQDADARELTQEVFLAVARAIRRFEIDPDRAQFRTWLFRIAKNCVLKLIAKRKRLVAVDSGTWEAISEGLTEEDPLEQAELEAYRRGVLLWAADKVRKQVQPMTWEAFHQTAILGRSVEEVATELGVARGVVYVARSRVISRLREEAARFDQELM